MTGLIIAGVLIVYLALASRYAFEDIDWTDLEYHYEEQRDREVDDGDRGIDPAVLEKDRIGIESQN